MINFAEISPFAILVLCIAIVASLILRKKRKASNQQDYVEPTQQNASETTQRRLTDEELQLVLTDLVRKGRKLEAIKIYKDNKFVSLVEAKDYIDGIVKEIEGN